VPREQKRFCAVGSEAPQEAVRDPRRYCGTDGLYQLLPTCSCTPMRTKEVVAAEHARHLKREREREIETRVRLRRESEIFACVNIYMCVKYIYIFYPRTKVAL